MSLWSRTLNYISKDVKRSVFDSWIKPLKAVSEKEDAIILEAGNTFQKDFIESNYSEYLRKTLKKLTNRKISVLFTIAKDQAEPKEAAPGVPGTKKAAVRASRPGPPSGFCRDYRLDNFIVGESNRLAFSACRSVAEAPGRVFNPLFLYGKHGLGKTHLLHAIGNQVNAAGSMLLARYSTVEEFGSDFTSSIQKKDFDAFLYKYRYNDILLIDDINLIAGKEGFQNMFLHTFNALYLAGKQIVLTSDRPPKETKNLQPRLMNRFEQGLVVEILSPDMNTRQQILRSLAARENFAIEPSHIQYIASRLLNDVRKMEGFMKRLIMESRINKKAVNSETIDRILGIFIQDRAEDLSLDQIINKTAEYFRVPAAAVYKKRKDKGVLVPRQIAAYIAVSLFNMPVTEVARGLNRTHSSVLHSRKRILDAVHKDLVIKNAVDSIVTDLRNGF